MRRPTPDSDEGFNIRKNKDRAKRKEAERQGLPIPQAVVERTVLKAPGASVPSANDKPLDPVLHDKLHNFLARKGYNVSDNNMVSEAEKHLRLLVDLEVPMVTSNVEGPPTPQVTACAHNNEQTDERAAKEKEP